VEADIFGCCVDVCDLVSGRLCCRDILQREYGMVGLDEGVMLLKRWLLMSMQGTNCAAVNDKPGKDRLMLVCLTLVSLGSSVGESRTHPSEIDNFS
jgi:hypothetical protein